MFRNLRFFRIEGDWPASEEALSAALEQAAFQPCASWQETSSGFEPPLAELGDLLCRRVMGIDLMQLRIQSRVLPAAAIREALDERVAQFRSRTRRDPSRQEKRELKEEVHAELLPRSLVKSDRVRGLYTRGASLLAIGSTTAKRVDAFLDQLSDCLPGARFVPAEFKLPAEQFMTRLFNGDAPPAFSLGRECRMRDPSEGGSSVTWLDMDIGDRPSRQLLQGGLRIDRLGFGFSGLLRGTVDHEWAFRKLKLEGQEDDGDLLVEDEPAARLDAELVLFGGALEKLAEALS